MHYHQLFMLSVLAAAPFHNLAKSLAPPWDDIRAKHSWNAVPPNWETLGHPPAGTTIDLHIALKPHHENALIDALYKVSVPGSPEHVLSNPPPRTMYSHVPLLCCRYGAHLSKEQVFQLVAPHPDTLKLVNSWLEHHDVPSSSISTTHGGSWLKITGVPVSKANELLGASYQVYRHTGTNDTTILRTIGYALPAVLHKYVQTVVPTTYFTSPRTLWQTPVPRNRSVGATVDMGSREPSNLTVLSSRNDENEIGITPSKLRLLYRTFAYVPTATHRNVLGLLNEYPSQADLREFMTECRSDAVDAAYTVVQINGGEYDQSHPSKEANLGVQYGQAMTYPTPLVFYSLGGRLLAKPGSNEPDKGDQWREWLEYLNNQPNAPQTIAVPTRS
jgi:tripeptidyl-peptidase-1